MQIESKIKRNGGTHIPMGTVTYHFAPLADGAHVAEVLDEAHQDRFLSISEGFRLYRPGQPAAAAEVLLGSSEHPASFSIGGKDYALGDIVALAHKSSGLDATEWNELDESTRADMIDEQLDKLEAAATPPAPPVPVSEVPPPSDADNERVLLAAQYKEKTGRAPHHTWSSEKIREELAKD